MPLTPGGVPRNMRKIERALEQLLGNFQDPCWSAPFILSVPTSGQHQIKNIVQLADGKWKVVYGETPEP